MQSEAQVATNKASIYLKQLCRHFQHHIPAEFNDERGTAEFERGSCELLAVGETLIMRVHSATPEGLDNVQQILTTHLQRFAFRDNLAVTWNELASSAAQ